MEFPRSSRVSTDDHISIFFRHAGSTSNPAILLLHGYPSSSFYFRDLMTLLSSHYYVVAPDLPGFGFTLVESKRYIYTFANLTTAVSQFLDALEIERFAMYVFDFGAPVGFRLALQRPQDLTAIISQNGNMYEEGLGTPWESMRRFWSGNSDSDTEAVKSRIGSFERTKWQYVQGSIDMGDIIQPEYYCLDFALLQRPTTSEAMLSLFYDYRHNVELYPQFQQMLRDTGLPLLAVWGQNDVSFIPAGAEAFTRDAGDAEVHLVEAGHFALLGLEDVFAALIRSFLSRKIDRK